MNGCIMQAVLHGFSIKEKLRTAGIEVLWKDGAFRDNYIDVSMCSQINFRLENQCGAGAPKSLQQDLIVCRIYIASGAAHAHM